MERPIKNPRRVARVGGRDLIDQSSSAKGFIKMDWLFGRRSQNRASTELALPRFCKSRTLFRYRRNPQPRGIASHSLGSSLSQRLFTFRARWILRLRTEGARET
jgi:hypothetical protein